MLDLPPPHSQASERAILAAVLLEPEELAGLRGGLYPEHFYFDAHARMWESALATDGDIVRVCRELMRTGTLGRVGGQRAVAELVLDSDEPIDDIWAHVEIVIECWRNRRLIRALRQVTAELYGELSADDAWMRVREECAA